MSETVALRPAREVARWVIEVEANALRGLTSQLDASFDEAVERIHRSSGRVVTTGMGKSGLVMKKIAATLASTGTPSLFLHPAEAIHGDLGMIVDGDIVLAASYSGKTDELLRLVEIVARLDVPLIAMTGQPDSPLARLADLHLSVAIDKEACPLNLAPTASTTATLALGDALAMALLEVRGFTPDDFARLHPGGSLGRKLLKVSDLMRTGDDLPTVRQHAAMPEAIYQMSKKGLGITAVTDDDGRLIGCISDGDLRRLLETDPKLLERRASECMRPEPRTIDGDALAPAALERLEHHRITSLFVDDDEGRLAGIIHLHDLWRLELF
ncbi:MAG: KpsF/GutQ family sugar-phosphate isomerase [Acidobacteriota bacterium]